VLQNSIPLEGFLNPESLVGDFGIHPGMKIADFGSGSGHVAVLLAQRTGQEGLVTAVDILEDKLDAVRVKAKAAGINNIETIRANLEVPGSSGLPDRSQDLVVLVNVLFQSTRKTDIIRESHRVLRSGGKIAIVEWKKGAGGLGPPEDLRTDDAVIQGLFSKAGLVLDHAFNAGQLHYGMIFNKP